MSTTKTPSLKQYPVCKDSRVTWIGRVPDHWEVGNLRYFTRSLDGARIPLSAEQRGTMQGTIPYWGANSVIDHVNDWTFNEPLVLVGEDGAPFQDPSRDVAFFVDEKVWVNNHIHVIRCGSRLNPKFFTYVLNTVDYTNFITGSTRDKLTQRDLGNIPIQVPLISEQAAIVRYLDDADQRIWAYVSAKERLIALLEEERQAVFNQAVTQGLDPYSKLKPSGVEWLGDVPEHWEIRRGKRLFSPRQELAKPNDIQLSATQAYGVIPQDEYEQRVGRRVVKISLHLEKRQHVEVDDFVISMRSFEGGLERAWATGCIRSSYVVLRPTIEVDVEFFSYLFKSQAYIQALQSTANFIRDGQDLNFNNFCAVDLPFPPTEEQRRMAVAVVEATANIDTTIARARRQIHLMEEYRTRLIADVVTGEMDVREAKP